MQAEFEIIANDKNVTALLKDRLVSLSITDKPGLEADSCEIRLDDRGGKIAIPPKGALLKVSLGWSGQGLSYMGCYKVDEVGLEGPPALITIRAKGADMRQSAKSTRSQGYEDRSLAAIVAELARRHGWQPVCKVEAQIARADQVGESDLHFITRLARAHGATATVKDGKLLVLPRGGGQSASGQALPALTLTPSILSRYSLTFADRSAFGKVQAKAHDPASGKQIEVDVPNPDGAPGAEEGEGPIHVDRHIYPTPDAAKAAAQARLGALNRATASGSLTMPGRADIAAEKTIRLQGIKPEADGDYLVEAVTHSFAHSGWQTTAEINAGNRGKSKAGFGQPL